MFGITIDRLNTTTMVTAQRAEELTTRLNSEDEDWTYVARHDPKGTGYSRVEVYDEDGYLLGSL